MNQILGRLLAVLVAVVLTPSLGVAQIEFRPGNRIWTSVDFAWNPVFNFNDSETSPDIGPDGGGFGSLALEAGISETVVHPTDTVTGVLSAELSWSDAPHRVEASGSIGMAVSHSEANPTDRLPTGYQSVSGALRGRPGPGGVATMPFDADTPMSVRYRFDWAYPEAGGQSGSSLEVFSSTDYILGVSTTGDNEPFASSGSSSGYFEDVFLQGHEYRISFGAYGDQSNGFLFGTNRFDSWAFTLLVGEGATQGSAAGPSGAPPAPVPAPDLGAIIPGDGFELVEDEPFFFDDVESGLWYDPVAATGFVYAMQDGALFTEVIDFADGFDRPFSVWAEGQHLGTFGEDDGMDFVALLGHGVSEFAVTGITPTVDGEDPFAFPIQLAFDTATADFAQFALLAGLDGDYNASGQVEQGDLDLVLLNWGVDTTPGSGAGVPAGWVNDLPVGQIEQTELDKVLLNWGSASAPNFSANPAVVPEPGIVTVFLGVLTLGWRRRSA